jgi:DNA end-binding protein Ku
MAARSIASVTIAFGMVSIPVKIYAATQSRDVVSFNLLHKACGSRLRQQYVCAAENVVVPREDMVKGYEFAKDQYVAFTPEELKELEEKGTQTVEITEFVPSASIDPVFYDKAYFLGPDKRGDKPYALLAESMRQTGRTAVGRYAARGKQYIVQLRPVKGGLVMQQLLYAPEVRSIDELDIAPAHVQDKELALAKQLIEHISSDAFDPTKYEDEVQKRIKEAVEGKVEGKAIAISPPATETGGQIIDLMEALRASLASKPKTPGGGRARRLEQAPAALADEGVPQMRKGPRKASVEAVTKRKATRQ